MTYEQAVELAKRNEDGDAFEYQIEDDNIRNQPELIISSGHL